MKEWFLFSSRVWAAVLAFVGICCSFTSSSNAANLRMEILPQYRAKPLPFAKLSLTNAFKQQFSVTRLDMLLSDLALHRKGGDWIENTNWQAYLSVGEKRMSFDAAGLPRGEYDALRFHVGLRPEINHAKTTEYPAQHPLNPNVNGMYWGWVGGYVFFAIEGNWDSNGKVSGYSYHIGNDPQLMTVQLPISLSADANQTIDITLNLNELFDEKFSESNSSTHSRKGDALAAHWKKNIETAFHVVKTRSTGSQIVSADEDTRPKQATALTTTHPYRFTFSSQFPMPELPRDNPLTDEGVELGRQLFFDKILSINEKQSCASCHDPAQGFTDSPKRFSIGAEGEAGTRNAMPLFNLAWKKTFFWDGRAASVREQVLQPIQNPIEMHETLSNVVAKLERAPGYKSAFERAFGTTEISSERIAKALEQFVLTQLSYDSKFDRAVDGKAELTDEEKRGFQLFITEYDPRHEQFGADCFHCHGGSLFQSQTFGNNGLDGEFKDLGRYLVTTNDADKGRFSVPSLRNVELTAPYMHDGRFKTLEEVIEHYATGVKRSPTLDPNIAKHPDGGVPLNAADKKALVAFLKTLTDERFRH